jgi:hypothetical protein
VNDQAWVLVTLLVAVLSFWLGSRSSSWKSQAAESMLQQALNAYPMKESLATLADETLKVQQTMEHLDGLIGAQVTLLQRGAHLKGMALDEQVKPSNLGSETTFPTPPGRRPVGAWGERKWDASPSTGHQPTTLGPHT